MYKFDKDRNTRKEANRRACFSLTTCYLKKLEKRDKEEKSYFPELMTDLQCAYRDIKQKNDRIYILENTIQ